MSYLIKLLPKYENLTYLTEMNSILTLRNPNKLETIGSLCSQDYGQIKDFIVSDNCTIVLSEDNKLYKCSVEYTNDNGVNGEKFVAEEMIINNKIIKIKKFIDTNTITNIIHAINMNNELCEITYPLCKFYYTKKNIKILDVQAPIKVINHCSNIIQDINGDHFCMLYSKIKKIPDNIIINNTSLMVQYFQSMIFLTLIPECDSSCKNPFSSINIIHWDSFTNKIWNTECDEINEQIKDFNILSINPFSNNKTIILESLTHSYIYKINYVPNKIIVEYLKHSPIIIEKPTDNIATYCYSNNTFYVLTHDNIFMYDIKNNGILKKVKKLSSNEKPMLFVSQKSKQKSARKVIT